MNLSLKINNNNYYYLAQDYLDIAKGYDFTSLEGIDEFLHSFSKENIINSIRNSNILADTSILDDCELVITYFENKKIREYEAHTFDELDYITFDVIDFIFKNINNKNITNQINNYFINKKYIPLDLQEFAKIIKDGSLVEITNIYFILEYRSKRILKDYIFKEILPKLDEKSLIRGNKTNKNDV